MQCCKNKSKFSTAIQKRYTRINFLARFFNLHVQYVPQLVRSVWTSWLQPFWDLLYKWVATRRSLMKQQTSNTQPLYGWRYDINLLTKILFFSSNVRSKILNQFVSDRALQVVGIHFILSPKGPIYVLIFSLVNGWMLNSDNLMMNPPHSCKYAARPSFEIYFLTQSFKVWLGQQCTVHCWYSVVDVTCVYKLYWKVDQINSVR